MHIYVHIHMSTSCPLCTSLLTVPNKSQFSPNTSLSSPIKPDQYWEQGLQKLAAELGVVQNVGVGHRQKL